MIDSIGIDYAMIWAGLIAFAVLAYIILDGFDLGIGILFPFIKNKTDQETAMNSVAPIWDGNETWLVLGEVDCLPSSRWLIQLLCRLYTCRSY